MDHNVWLARFIQRKEQALAELHDDFYEVLVLYAYKKIGDLWTAEEIASDCFLALWEYAKKTPFSSLDDIKKFLYVITRNKCISHLRKAKTKDQYIPLLDTHEEADADLKFQLEAEIIKRVREILQELPDAQRRTVQLHYFEDLKMPEVAEYTNVEVNTSFRLKARAIKSLREKVTPLVPSYFKAVVYWILAVQFL